MPFAIRQFLLSCHEDLLNAIAERVGKRCTSINQLECDEIMEIIIAPVIEEQSIIVDCGKFEFKVEAMSLLETIECEE